ncbi:MAG: T9SS type A sorting domain-containing protein, partial [bacterium]
WIPQDTGRFEVKCSTMLAGDEDPSNDRLTDTVVVVMPGGVADRPTPTGAARFALYPNPARNRVWLESPESSTLYGPDGRRVALLQPGENDIRYLSPGVYFVRRQDTGESGRLVLVE